MLIVPIRTLTHPSLYSYPITLTLIREKEHGMEPTAVMGKSGRRCAMKFVAGTENDASFVEVGNEWKFITSANTEGTMNITLKEWLPFAPRVTAMRAIHKMKSVAESPDFT